jgi:hypothetical protein
MHPLPGKTEEISPRKFDLDGETVEVTAIFENWHEDEKGQPKHFFKVKGDNDHFYTLLFDEKKHEWYCE